MGVLYRDNYGWRNHPAKKMWENHPYALVAYGLVICTEWKKRGYVDNTYPIIKTFGLFDEDIICEQSWLQENRLLPYWLGDERLHSSHRSNLIRKNPGWYRVIKGWRDPDNLPYWWPI